MKIILGFLLVVLCAGCSFQVGIDWNGKTFVDDARYTEPRQQQQQQRGR